MDFYDTFYVVMECADVSEHLSATFSGLDFWQSSGNIPSSAEFRFLVKNLFDGEYNPDKIPKSIEASVDRVFNFQIFSLSKKPMTEKHYHVVTKAYMRYSNDGETYTLVVHTMEKLKSAMLLNNRSVEWKGSFEETLTKMVADNGGILVDAEKSTEVPEFKVLRQGYDTNDMDFVTNEINPRASSGNGSGAYRLFTTDGINAFWGTLGYKATVKELPEVMTVLVEPSIGWQWVAQSGSVRHTTFGFDLDSKKVLKVTGGPDVQVSYGSVDIAKSILNVDGYTSSPYRTEKGVRSHNDRNRYAERYAAYPVAFKIRGSAGWDKVPYNILVKKIHEKGGGEIMGYASTIHHSVRNSEYSVTVSCLRDKTNGI